MKTGCEDTNSVDIVQLILVLELRFCLPDLLIDLPLHPGLDLRVVRQEGYEGPCAGTGAEAT